MKKVIKVILLILLLLVVLIVIGFMILMHIVNERKENYCKYSTSAGQVETKYTAPGDYKVSSQKYDANNEKYGKFEVWYPTEIENSNDKYPLVVMANGTGTKASQYQEVFKHLASWGFIVIGNEDENSKTGESSSATLDYFLNLNEDKNSIFYGKIDIENIGITGHSQGGVGAINAVTNQDNGNFYKAVFSISATSRYHAEELNKSEAGWSIDLSKVTIPIAMVAGTGYFDAGSMDEYSVGELPEGKAQGICPLWWLNECYDILPDSVDKFIARQTDKDHGDMLHSADGYMTAWFMYYLQEDESAGNAFWGNDAEIYFNPNWQNVKSELKK